jgi:hypothetical protein
MSRHSKQKVADICSRSATTNAVQAERTAFETTVNIYEKQGIKVTPPLMQSMDILSALCSISVTLIGMGKTIIIKDCKHPLDPFQPFWHK